VLRIKEFLILITPVLCPGADPFQSVALPETVEDVLEDFVARCIAFNRWGTLLAGAGSPLAMRLPCTVLVACY
jgi:hypothetical protein